LLRENPTAFGTMKSSKQHYFWRWANFPNRNLPTDFP